MMTGAGGRRRGSWRKAKSRRKPEKAVGDSARKAMAPNEALHHDQPDKLLLSALKYWEVERDIIEERLATRSATASS